MKTTILALIALASTLGGCISSAPIVPVTPQNQEQISSCQNTATFHNGIVMGDFVLGGSSTALGAIGALVSDSQAKTDLAYAAAGTAAAMTVGAALAGMSASDFSNSQCGTVVGPLPAAHKPQ